MILFNEVKESIIEEIIFKMGDEEYLSISPEKKMRIFQEIIQHTQVSKQLNLVTNSVY